MNEQEPKETLNPVKMEKLELCRDDFIEWILRSTNDDSEFRVYRGPKYIMIGIDKAPFLD